MNPKTALLILALSLGSLGRLLAQQKSFDVFAVPFTEANTVSNYVSKPPVTASATTPVSRLIPADVVQDSIQLYRFSTNSFAVRWTYTEAGAKKALASWTADPNHPALSDKWKAGWLQRKSDKGFFISEKDALEFMQRLKNQ